MVICQAEIIIIISNFVKIQPAVAHRGQSRALLLRWYSRVQSYTPAPCSSQNTTLSHAASTDCKQTVLLWVKSNLRWRIVVNTKPCFCAGTVGYIPVFFAFYLEFARKM